MPLFRRFSTVALAVAAVYWTATAPMVGSSTESADTAWHFLGPNNLSGAVTALVVHPEAPQQLLAAVSQGLWRSTDGGANWTQVLDRPGPVYRLVRHPVNANQLIGTGSGPNLYLSQDGGLTWQILPGPSGQFGNNTNPVPAFSSDGRYLFVASQNGLVRSSDAGNTWTPLSVGPSFDVTCSSTDPNRCVARASSGAQVTTNAGATWQSVGLPPGASNLLAHVTFAPSVDGIVYALRYAGATYHLVSSQDGGLTFRDVNTSLLFDGSALWVDPTDMRVLVTTVGGNLVRSADMGLTFATISTAPASGFSGVSLLVAAPDFNGTSNQRLYAGGRFGLVRTDTVMGAAPDVGWTSLSAGLGGAWVRQVGAVSSTVLLGVVGDRIVRLTDGDPAAEVVLSPTQTGGGLPTLGIDQVGDFAYVSVGARLFRTSDGGRSFDEVSGPGEFLAEIEVRGNVLFGRTSKRIVRSTDARGPAPSWTTIRELPAGTPGTGDTTFLNMALAPGGTSVLTITTRSSPPAHCCHYSVAFILDADNAASVTVDVQTPLSRGHLRRLVPVTADGVVTYRLESFGSGTPSTLLRSTDTGRTWVALPDVAAGAAVADLIAHPRNPAWVFAATDQGLFQSTDGGQSWTREPTRTPTAVELAWRGTSLVAGAPDSGLWRRDITGRPSMSIDEPASAASVSQPFRIAGWAVDSADATDTGVDAVQVYAYPNPGSGQPPIFLGSASYGDSRPDVAAAQGASRFEPSGFSLTVDSLPSGRYQFEVYQHSTFDGRFVAATFTQHVGGGPIAVEPTALRFGARRAGANGPVTAVTAAQTVTVSFPGAESHWVVTANASWLETVPSKGSGNGSFAVRIADVLPTTSGDSALVGTVTVTPTTVGIPAVHIPVVLDVRLPSVPSPPFGQVDTPVQNAHGVMGAVAVTGWVLDDVGVADVQVYRNCLFFDVPASCQVIGGRSLVLLGQAPTVSGARPDVAAAYPGYPAGQQAGWGLLLLTPMLPDVYARQAFGGQGPIELSVVATDVEGHHTFLGRSVSDQSPTLMTLDNASSAKPFGTIDWPAQGATVSGLIPISGWVLTPDSNLVADGTDIVIPARGGITLFVDGTPIAAAVYDQCRGTVGSVVPAGQYCDDDIASTFGHPTPRPTFSPRVANPTRFRNLDSGRGAIASMLFDTTQLTNGWHSIAWSVTDSAGRVEGIGSRNVNVRNTASPPRSPGISVAAAPVDTARRPAARRHER